MDAEERVGLDRHNTRRQRKKKKKKEEKADGESQLVGVPFGWVGGNAAQPQLPVPVCQR